MFVGGRTDWFKTTRWEVEGEQDKLCGTQNGPQIFDTISFAACGSSDNRNAIAHCFCILNGVAAVHGGITYPISSLFSPSVSCVKIPSMEEDLEWAAAAEGLWNAWAMGWCQTETFQVQGSHNQPLAEAESALLTMSLGTAQGMCHRARENKEPNASPWNHPWGTEHWESSRDNG